MRTNIILCLVTLTLTTPAARAQEDGFIMYAIPKEDGYKPEDVQLTTWTDGTRLYIAPQTLHLREKPDRKSESLGNLTMGDAVVVRKADGKPTQVEELVNHWYEVEVETGSLKGKKGHAFGSFLTPHRLEDDFDGDGQPEIATVSFAGDGSIRVRFLDRSVKGDPHTSQVDIRPAGEEFLSQRGGRVKASLLEAKQAGLPLVKLESRIEACGDFFDGYVSYVTPGGKPEEQGTAREALIARGSSDSPMFANFTVAFQADRKGATVETTVTEADENGKEKVVEKTTETYSFKDGKYELKK